MVLSAMVGTVAVLFSLLCVGCRHSVCKMKCSDFHGIGINVDELGGIVVVVDDDAENEGGEPGRRGQKSGKSVPRTRSTQARSTDTGTSRREGGRQRE